MSKLDLKLHTTCETTGEINEIVSQQFAVARSKNYSCTKDIHLCTLTSHRNVNTSTFSSDEREPRWGKTEGSNERFSANSNLYQVPSDLYSRSVLGTAPPGRSTNLIQV